jgi:serine/threonine-protein kinase
VQVPALYYASEAEGLLTAAGLKLGSRNEASNDTVPAGIVVEQNPAAGTTVEEGTAVDIVVSTGPKQAPTAVQATPTGVGAVSRQASTTQAVSTTAQTAPAPTVNNKTVGKEQKGKKKGKK